MVVVTCVVTLGGWLEVGLREVGDWRSQSMVRSGMANLGALLLVVVLTLLVAALVVASLITWMAGRVCTVAVVVTMNTLLLFATGCDCIEHSTWAIERASGDIEGMAFRAAVADRLGTTCAAEMAGAMCASGAVGTTAGVSLTAGRVGTTCMAGTACVSCLVGSRLTWCGE